MYGVEDNEDLAMATKVNMILHGDGNANIEKADGLAGFGEYHRDRTRISTEDANHPYKYPVNEQFDCVISNPPFSLKEDDRTLNKYSTRFGYVEGKNSENLFIERWFQLLKEGGRLGVVLPDSVFDTNENLYIRMFLYRFFVIKAVVSLPQVAFQPYTPTKTSLLFAVKKTRKEVDAWDKAWRRAANTYGKLRVDDVVKYVLRNHWLRESLIELANKADIEWYPRLNILSDRTVPTAVKEAIFEGLKDMPNQKRKYDTVFEELSTFLKEKKLQALEQRSEQAKSVLQRLLRNRVPKDMQAPLSELLEVAYDEIVEASELNYSEDPRGQEYCNAWWCFSEVTLQPRFNADIFFAEAKHVGYKRTTRHPEGIPQPNDLFREDNQGYVTIDADNSSAILDALRHAHVFAR